MEAPDELQINTVSHNTANANADRPKPTCHQCKKPGHHRNQCQLLKKQREQTESSQNIPGNKNSDANTSYPNSNVNNPNNNNNKNSKRAKRKPKTVYPPCEAWGKQTTPQRNATMEPMQPINRLPGTEYPKDKIRSKKEPTKKTRMKLLRLQPKFKMKMPRLHSGATIDRPEVTHSTLPSIPQVVWQQPQLTHLTNILNVSTNETHKNTPIPELNERNEVEAQTLPIKDTSSQISGSDTESLLENQTRSIPVQCPKDSKKQQNEIQRNETDMTAYDIGDDNSSPPEITASQIEERLVRDDITNELYMPLSSTIVLKRKKEMLYVPLDFENGLTIVAVVDSGAFFSALAQKELDSIKQQAPVNILNIDEPPYFQIQVANGQLEKPIATATLKFDIGHHIFAEHFVVMKNLRGPIIELHFMRHNSVVIDTTHGLIHFPHLTMEFKTAMNQTTAGHQAVLIHDSITIPQLTTKLITAFVDHLSEWNTTGTVTLVEKFTKSANLIISHSTSTIIDRKIAASVTNTTESPYTIIKNTQIAELSVANPEQCRFIKPVDMAILSMIPGGDPDLITYLTELLTTNKPDQQNNTFWFPTPENPGNTEDHTPIQTRILTELREFQLKEKLNPKDDIKSRVEFLKRFDWTDTLLKETEKQAVEDIIVEYHDIFARHRMDIGLYKEFKVKLTPKDDKVVYRESLPMPIHLKEDLIVELALMHKYGIITVLPFSKYASPIFAQRKPKGNHVSLWISGKSTH